MEYKVGDKVLIVDKWVAKDGRQNHDGEMDKWLGQVMTVKSDNGAYLHMEEDQHDEDSVFGEGWFWYPEMIAGKFEKTDDYKPGDKVLIVSEWNDKTNQSNLGGMDKWLGKIVTIHSPDGGFWRIKEDSCWVWNKHCIVGKLRVANSEEEKPQKTTSGTFHSFWGKSATCQRVAYIYGESSELGGYVGYTPDFDCGHDGKHRDYTYDPDFVRPDHKSSWFYEQSDISPVEWRVISREPRKGDFVRLKSNGPFSFSMKGQIMRVSNINERNSCVQVTPEDHIGFKVGKPCGTDYWNYRHSYLEVIEPILAEEETPDTSHFEMFYAYDAHDKKLCIVYGEGTNDYLVYHLDRDKGHDGNGFPCNRDPKAVIPPDSSYWVLKKNIHHIYFTTSSEKPAVGDYIIPNCNWDFNYENQLLKVSAADGHCGVKVKDHYAKTVEVVDDNPDYIWWYAPHKYKRVEAIYDSMTNECVWSRKSLSIVQECICIKSAPGLSIGTIYRVSDGTYVDDNGNNRDDAYIYLKKKI